MKSHKLLAILLSLICIVISVSGCGGQKVITTEQTTGETTTPEITTHETTTVEPTTQPEPKVNYVFYLFGINDRDENPHDLNRSDTIMVVSVNFNKKVINIVSILRDTKAAIPYNDSQKINAAYNIGGVDMAIETVNNNFDLNIHDYVSVGLSGLNDVVDAVGGIDIYLEYMEAAILNEHYEYTTNYTEGVNHLNGESALVYSRIRIIDNDVVRASRQHNVISAIIKEVKNSTLGEKISLIKTCLRYVKTNISFVQMLDLVRSGVTSFDINYRTVPDENYETDVYSCIDEHEEWVWIYDTHAAGERIREIIY